jgi:flagellar hook-basal body complex protein FliE
MPAAPASLPDFRPKPLNGELYNGSGGGIAALGHAIGAEGVTRDGLFDDAMLQALDRVNALQQAPAYLAQQEIIDPDSVDVHDITKAQADADLALDITRTILNRIVQAWKDVINTR